MDDVIETAPVDVRADRRADGSIILMNGLNLPPVDATLPARLAHWSRKQPDQLFLSEGDELLRFGDAERLRRDYARRILALPVSKAAPLMIVANNGISHALGMLAATSVGVPVAVISPTYISPAAAPWLKFETIVRQIGPGLVLGDDPHSLAAIFEQIGRADIPIRAMRSLEWLSEITPVADRLADEAEAGVGPDTIAKLLLTSGSTGQPKAVANTQRMMVSNMLGLSRIWPFLQERPPISVDWLPWNHTFGGNCCFNITLWFGGHSHIDSGRPTPALIGETISALKRWRPTLYYNVPVGFEALLPALEDDRGFAAEFFAGLEFIFSAGAALPAALRTRLEAIARATLGHVPNIVGGWGSTETAPFSTVLYFEQPHANNLGAPMPGTEVKLVPNDGRYELRVKGPNVMPYYWEDKAATEAAFDDEGFYRIGDAARFVDEGDPSKGILFDGRVAENFKLTTGTWVNVGALRLAVITASEDLISDAVVTGEGRHEIGLLIFPNERACRQLIAEKDKSGQADTPFGHPAVRERLDELLTGHNRSQMGSSTRIGRFMIMTTPPSPAAGEITDKGYINQRRVLQNRAALVESLYSGAFGI